MYNVNLKSKQTTLKSIIFDTENVSSVQVYIEWIRSMSHTKKFNNLCSIHIVLFLW